MSKLFVFWIIIKFVSDAAFCKGFFIIKSVLLEIVIMTCNHIARWQGLNDVIIPRVNIRCKSVLLITAAIQIVRKKQTNLIKSVSIEHAAYKSDCIELNSGRTYMCSSCNIS